MRAGEAGGEDDNRKSGRQDGGILKMRGVCVALRQEQPITHTTDKKTAPPKKNERKRMEGNKRR
jgi:hypothetical protein